jgi:hypothetical protein
MKISTFADRARGFIGFAETHLERGNKHAVLETLENLRRLVAQLERQHPDAPERLRERAVAPSEEARDAPDHLFAGTPAGAGRLIAGILKRWEARLAETAGGAAA